MVARKELSESWIKPNRHYERTHKRPLRSRQSQAGPVHLRFQNLPLEIRSLVFEQLSQAYEEEGFRKVFNEVSIVHPGARRLTTIRFEHSLDIKSLAVSKWFLTAAVTAHARSGSIRIVFAREKYLRVGKAIFTNKSAIGTLAAQIRHKMLTNARRSYLTGRISPFGLGLPLAPPVWGPELRYLELLLPRKAYWMTSPDPHTFFLTQGDVTFDSTHICQLTKDQLVKIVTDTKFPNGSADFTKALIGQIESPASYIALPDLSGDRWRGKYHFHFHITVICKLRTDNHTERLLLDCIFEAGSRQLLAISKTTREPVLA